MRVGGQRQAPAAPERDPVTIVNEAGWAPGPVWSWCGKSRRQRDSKPRAVQHVASRYNDTANPGPRTSCNFSSQMLPSSFLCIAMFLFPLSCHQLTCAPDSLGCR